MGLMGASSEMVCQGDQHCSRWARDYIQYCLCSVKDGVSLTLGLFSVISWGVAEIPQIITNYKEKSTEGLSIAFLMTWILGDLLNLFGCMLEPATLPTQYYMAVLYTMTTLILAGQTFYYSHVYHRLKFSGRYQQDPKTMQPEAVEKGRRQSSNGVCNKQLSIADGQGRGIDFSASGVAPSLPIPLPAVSDKSSLARDLYYTSARSLSRSHTPTAGSFIAQRSPEIVLQNSIEEPLLGRDISTQSVSPSSTKTMLCAVSSVTFLLGSFHLQQKETSRLGNMAVKKLNQGVVLWAGRKLLQVNGGLTQETLRTGSRGIGTILGCGMAAIYLGGRLPQICLNMRRANVEGLNPLMFIFALIGNATYVASILVNSLDWLNIKPNLPWLVDAAGCVILDAFILLQFIYFRCRTLPADIKHGRFGDA